MEMETVSSVGNLKDYSTGVSAAVAIGNVFKEFSICYVPPGSYVIDEPIEIKDSHVLWCPGPERAAFEIAIPPDASGAIPVAIQMHGNRPTLIGVLLRNYYANDEDYTYSGKYDGIGLYSTQGAVVRDVGINYPRIGLRLVEGNSFYGDFSLAVRGFATAGIDLSASKDISSSSNFIRISTEIWARPSTIFKDGYDPGNPFKEPWLYGVRIGGNVNTIVGGEITKTTVAIDDQGIDNRWLGVYVEHCGTIQLGGGPTSFDSHVALERPPRIGPETVVYGKSGLSYSRWIHFERPQASARDLKALWYFDDHGTVLDHSGAGHHKALVPLASGPSGVTPVASPFGAGLFFGVPADTLHRGALAARKMPMSAFDLTRPFTVVACFTLNRPHGSEATLMSWLRDDTTVARIGVRSGLVYVGTDVNPCWETVNFYYGDESPETRFLDVDHGPFDYPHGKKTDVQRWCWLGIFIYSVAGKAKVLDAFRTDAVTKNVDLSALSTANLCHLFHSPSLGFSAGGLCFLGVWQRELMQPEFVALINQKAHWTPTPRSTVSMKQLDLVDDRGAGHRIHYAASAPTNGTWHRGDICYHSAPSPGGHVGWVCTTGGSPGTWKSFGAISL